MPSINLVGSLRLGDFLISAASGEGLRCSRSKVLGVSFGFHALALFPVGVVQLSAECLALIDLSPDPLSKAMTVYNPHM